MKIKVYQSNIIINGCPTTLLLSDRNDLKLIQSRFPKIKIKGRPKFDTTTRFNSAEEMLVEEMRIIQNFIDKQKLTYEEDKGKE